MRIKGFFQDGKHQGIDGINRRETGVYELFFNFTGSVTYLKLQVVSEDKLTVRSKGIATTDSKTHTLVGVELYDTEGNPRDLKHDERLNFEIKFGLGT